MPWESVALSVLGSELKLVGSRVFRTGHLWEVEKVRGDCEVCPKCGTASQRRSGVCYVTVREAPLREKPLWLRIKKHRYYCCRCRKPFTEPVAGIMPRRRTTQRFRKAIAQACVDFSDLSRVRKKYHCSAALLYAIFYEQLETKLRERKGSPWPRVLGIDEHFFTRRKGFAEFVTVFANIGKRRLFEMAKGKDRKSLIEQLGDIPGRENVQVVVIDLSNGYRAFVREMFPNARIVADKFHALRLITPALIKARKEIQGHRKELRMRRLLLKSRKKIDYDLRGEIDRFLKHHPKLSQLYWCKERLHEFYRIRGSRRARLALLGLIEKFHQSPYEEVHRLKNTLKTWGTEILNYFDLPFTNGLTEAMNAVAKLVQRRAYGYKSFKNYRLRTLSACT